MLSQEEMQALSKMALHDPVAVAERGVTECHRKAMDNVPLCKVVAFAGPKGAGKDLAASYFIAHECRASATRLPFAGSLKQAVSSIFNIPLEVFEDPVAKETVWDAYPYETPRKLLQDVADTFRIMYGPDVWVNSWLKKYATLSSKWALITDLRFPNELDLVRMVGGKVIYVHRSEAEHNLRTARDAGDALATNASESHWSEIRARADYILLNNGTTADLAAEVANLIPFL